MPGIHVAAVMLVIRAQVATWFIRNHLKNTRFAASLETKSLREKPAFFSSLETHCSPRCSTSSFAAMVAVTIFLSPQLSKKEAESDTPCADEKHVTVRRLVVVACRDILARVLMAEAVTEVPDIRSINRALAWANPRLSKCRHQEQICSLQALIVTRKQDLPEM